MLGAMADLFPSRLPGVLSVAFLLGGCAQLSPEGGVGAVATLSQARVGVALAPIKDDADAARVAEFVSARLAAPLDAEGAVAIALAHSRDLQARLAGLRVAEADAVQAGRPRNPVFSFARLAGGDLLEYERSFLLDLLGLFTLPARAEAGRARFQAAQVALAREVVRQAHQARQDWLDAVAARQIRLRREAALDLAEAGAELARRMAEAGNFSAREARRAQVLRAELAAELIQARQAQTQARERLVRRLGLGESDAARLHLPERLPELPAALPEPAGPQAVADRLDTHLARLETEAQTRSLDQIGATRWLSDLDLAYKNGGERGEAHWRGYEIEVGLPVFDRGEARIAAAEARLRQARFRQAAIEAAAASELREARAGLAEAHALARLYRDEIAPLRAGLAEDALLRYNGMLVGPWDLLSETRRQVQAEAAAIVALRDYWWAESAWRMALDVGGGEPSPLSGGHASEPDAGH